MAQNITSLGFDIERFDSEKQHIIDGLSDIYQASKKIEQASISYGSAGGYSELKQQIAALADAIKQLDTIALKYIADQQQGTQAQKNTSNEVKNSTQAIKDETAALSDNISKKQDLISKEQKLSDVKSDNTGVNNAAPDNTDQNANKVNDLAEANKNLSDSQTVVTENAAKESAAILEGATTMTDAAGVSKELIDQEQSLSQQMQANSEKLALSSDELKRKQEELSDSTQRLAAMQQQLGSVNISDSAKEQIQRILSAEVKANQELTDSVKNVQAEYDATNSKQTELVSSHNAIVQSIKQEADANRQKVESVKETDTAAKSSIQVFTEMAQAMANASSFTEVYANLLGPITGQLVQAKAAQAEFNAEIKDLKSGQIAVDSIDDFNGKLQVLEAGAAGARAQVQNFTTILSNLVKGIDAGDGGVNQMSAHLVVLQRVIAALGEEAKNTDFGKTLITQASELSDKINDQRKDFGDYTKNIGRYAESLAPLFDAVGTQIDKLKAKQQELSDLKTSDPDGFAAQGGEEQIQRVTTAISQLEQIQKSSNDTSQNFNTTIRQTEAAFKEMATSGAQDAEFLNGFRDKISEVKAQFNSLNGTRANFSNYTNAVNVLREALSKATAEMSRLTVAGRAESAEGIKQAEEVKLLTTLVGQQEAGYKSLNTEVYNLLHSLESLDSAGLRDSEVFKQLDAIYTDAKRHVRELSDENKILSSTSPKLAALTAAAKGLGGIYAAGAGGAALFADGNEKVQKELNKLIAVMTLLQGLNELHELVLQKNAIAQALFGTTTVATTAALEGEAVATTEVTVATSGFGKALAFIAANPIVIVLAATAAAITYLVWAEHQEWEQVKKNAEAEEHYSEALKGVTEAAKVRAENSNNVMKRRRDDLQNQLEVEQKSGVNQARVLQITTQLAVLDKQIADDKKRRYEEDLKVEGGITAVLADQRVSLSKNNELYDEQSRKLARLADLQKDHVKYVKKGTEEPAETSNINLIAGLIEPIDEVIKKTKEEQDTFKKTSDAAAQNVKDLTGVMQDQKDAAVKIDQQKAETSKYYSDEERKAEYANVQREVADTQDKNNRILQNEHSTFQEKIAAMKSNADEEKRLAHAEERNVTTNPVSSNDDRKIAEKKYSEDVIKINRDTLEQIRKLQEEYDKRDFAARHATLISNLDESQAANQQIYNDTSKSLDERLGAYSDFIYAQEQEILEDAIFQKATKQLTDQEIIAIDAQTNNKLIDLKRKVVQEMSSIITQAGRDQLQEAQANDNYIDSEEKERNAKALSTLRQGSEEYARLKKELDDKLEDDEYNRKKEALQKQKQLDQNILASPTTSNEDKAKAAQDLSTTIVAINDNETSHILNNQKKIDAFYQKLAEKVSLWGDRAKEVIYDVTKLFEGNVDKQKNAVQSLEDTQETNYEAEVTRINTSSLTDQEKQEKLIELEAQRNAQKEENARRQRELDLKKAKYDRAQSIMNIILDTAVAVTKQLAIGNIVEAVIVGALGAAQLAVAISTPLPTYKKGIGGETIEKDFRFSNISVRGKSHPGGPAIVGDGGRAELAVLPNGKMVLTPSTATVMDLPKGTRVHPDAEKLFGGVDTDTSLPMEYVNEAMYRSMFIANAQQNVYNSAIEKGLASNDWNLMKWQTEELKKAMAKNGNTIVKNQVIVDLGHLQWIHDKITNF